MTRTWFALTPFAATLAAELLPKAQKKKIPLHTNLMVCQGWEVHTDATRLGRLLANLLTNAVHYTQAGGVELKAAWREDEAGKRMGLALIVTDTGPGISQEEQESIFEPFRAARAARRATPAAAASVWRWWIGWWRSWSWSWTSSASTAAAASSSCSFPCGSCGRRAPAVDLANRSPFAPPRATMKV